MKGRYVVVAAIASVAILAGGMAGVLSFTTTSKAGSSFEAKSEPDIVYDDVPDWLRETALHSLSATHLDGEPEEVYGLARTTFATWLKLEPGYSLSQDKVTEENRDDPIYAVFVRGKWGVVRPAMWTGGDENQPAPEMEYNLVAGRAVLDKRGEPITVQAWTKEKPARPAFGEPFNNQ